MGKDTGSVGQTLGFKSCLYSLVLEPVTTHYNCSLSEPDSIFLGPLQTAAEETRVLSLGS